MLLRLTRHPAKLEQGLLQHPQLRNVMSDLQKRGCCSGKMNTNKVFVSPDEFDRAAAASQQRQLGRHHVVVSEKLLPHVNEVIARMPHKENVKVQTQEPLVYLNGSMPPVTTRGTFLDVRDRNDPRTVVSV